MRDENLIPAAFEKQPGSTHCFACGVNNPAGLKVKFYDNGVDEVRVEYTVDAVYQGYPGLVHGGIIATILDEAVGRVSLIGSPTRLMMTGTMELKYRLPVPIETPLLIVARKIKDRGRVIQATGEVRLPDGRVAVEAALTVVEPPGGFQVDPATAETLGWKVYPDE